MLFLLIYLIIVNFFKAIKMQLLLSIYYMDNQLSPNLLHIFSVSVFMNCWHWLSLFLLIYLFIEITCFTVVLLEHSTMDYRYHMTTIFLENKHNGDSP